jgi:Sigma-70, region 4
LRRGVVPENESAWLHAIAKNVCRWHQRSASRRPATTAVEVEDVATPAQDEDTELLSDLREALDSLPERQRHALLLREWRGLSAHEIAAHLDLSPPATHALLTRARRSLAVALTTARSAALGVGSLAYELRSWIKGALGGASAKAAVATIAVAGAGAGAVAVAVEPNLGRADAGAAAAAAARPAAAPAAAPIPAVGSRRDAAAVVAAGWRDPGTGGVSGSSRPRLRGAGPATGRERLSRPGPQPGTAAAPEAERAPTESSGGTEAAAEPPARGVAELPSASQLVPKPPPLPPIDLPPVDPPDLPPLPEIDLPPLDVPVLPPVDVPPLDPPELPPLPTVDVPPIVPPELPNVDLPQLPPPPKLP